MHRGLPTLFIYGSFGSKATAPTILDGASGRTRSDTASLSCSARRGLLRHFPDAPGGTKIDYLLSLQRRMPVTKILFAVTACVLAVVGTAVSDAAEIKVLAAAPFKAALTEEFFGEI